MRNYIILNNQNSNTISGLIIQELAPISKPLQRTQVETIDGRDGDIVTPLGYAAYDKTFTIGLYGTFDINEVIAYFATKGTVIFSNEPDKYYYYQIVDQIDYERLVRYRVATVTMHVQPFKYSATEGTITVDASDTVSGDGSDIALDGTAEAPFNVLRHKGNATQKTLSGKNLLNSTPYRTGATYYNIAVGTQIDAETSANVAVSSSGDKTTIACSATWVGAWFLAEVEEGKTYHVYARQIGSGCRTTKYTLDANHTIIRQLGNVARDDYVTDTNITVDTGEKYIAFTIGCGSPASTLTFETPQIELGTTKTDYEEFCGGIPSPSPDYPQDIQVVTGDSTVKITGKNLFDSQFEQGSYSGTTGTKTVDNTIYRSADKISVEPNTTYTLSLNGVSQKYVVLFYDNSEQYLSQNTSLTNGTFTTLANARYIAIRCFASDYTSDFANLKPQLELGAATAYEPYKGQSYVIPFGDTYLAKIGDYADEPVKVDGTWYIRRAIGKVVLDGTENINAASDYIGMGRFDILDYSDGIRGSASASGAISDHFRPEFSNRSGVVFLSGINSHINVIDADYSNDLSGFKTWLGTHTPTVYYVLATPTDEAITDQDLIDALDELYDQAHSYKGHTHITATAADGNAPAVLSVEVGEDNESTVTNAGNTTSRPILTIYGQGDIGVYINDVEVLDVALGDEEYITLDSVEMEAYKDTTANLKNRLVTGDYSKLALNAGANKIRFTGKVTKYEISKYSRWL